MIHDLHLHTSASDGKLTPAQLIDYARRHHVDVLAITDHDTTEGYAEVRRSLPADMGVIAGVELSAHWCNRGIHIVGLNIDIDHVTLREGLARQAAARERRAGMIAERLTRLGMDTPIDAVKAIASSGSIGRPHFARHLVNIGAVRNTRAAFRKYLGTGKPGDVRTEWVDVSDAVAWIRASGGVAVLAHPAKYGMTTSRLKALLDDFVAVGGRGIEVVSGRQDNATTRRIAALATEYGLAASTGSDFHSPDQHWSRPGGFAPLPADLKPVWTLW